MEEVFVEHFSKEEFSRLHSKYFADSSSSDGDNEDHQQARSESVRSRAYLPCLVNPPASATDDTVERLKAELESIKIGNDSNEDWESMF
jgi:hypothetical protein